MDIPDEILAYAAARSTPEPAFLQSLREETEQTNPRARMLCGPAVGGLLRTLVSIHHPRTVLEVGTFTGYSALWMASGLPEGATLHTVEADPAMHAVAARHIAASGLGRRITQHLGRAPEILETIPGPFDFVFMDADKRGYAPLYDFLFPRVPVGGLLVVDNVLFRGEVLHAAENRGPVAEAVHRFNEQVAADRRAEVILLPLRDGVSVIRKVSE